MIRWLFFATTLGFSLLVGTPRAEADRPYVVGGSDDPNLQTQQDAEDSLLRVELLRQHRYDERYSASAVVVSPDGQEVAGIGRLSQHGARAWSVGSGKHRRLPKADFTPRQLAYDFAMKRVAFDSRAMKEAV